MTKEEKIKEAWGDYYEIIKNELDEHGRYNYYDNITSERKRKLWQFENIEIHQINNSYLLIPSSIKGIENNNGWIKIESKNLILPIDGTEVHFYHGFINENGIQTEYHKGIFNAALGFTSYYDSENYKVKDVTHYQPIEKPKPPLY